MIELGKTQCLNVVKKVDFGVYLGTEEDKVLLPKKMVPEDIEAGDALTVLYTGIQVTDLLPRQRLLRCSLASSRFLKFRRSAK